MINVFIFSVNFLNSFVFHLCFTRVLGSYYWKCIISACCVFKFNSHWGFTLQMSKLSQRLKIYIYIYTYIYIYLYIYILYIYITLIWLFITAWLYSCLLSLIYFVLPFATNRHNFPFQSLFNCFVLSDYVKGLTALY